MTVISDVKVKMCEKVIKIKGRYDDPRRSLPERGKKYKFQAWKCHRLGADRQDETSIPD